MNILRERFKVERKRWARYNHNLITPLGENGSSVSGCKEHISLSKKAAAEGMVLLENDNALPLKSGTTVSLFGIGSLDYVKGGGGSGEVYSAYVKNIYEGFKEKEPDFKVYEPVTEFYYNYALKELEKYPDCHILSEPEKVDEELIKEAAKSSDVAIITIHRFSGEGFDRSSDKGDFCLTDREEEMVKTVTEYFDTCIAVLDVGGMVDVQWAVTNDSIKGILLAWQAGQEGGSVIADILCGYTNPSGKLTDTFAKTFSDYPSADTFNESVGYVDYFEDIYVGYRYFLTIPGADKKMSYPFGYGLSYTTFDISRPEAKLSGDKITVTVTVKNTGNISGKEVVQVYCKKPQGKLGNPALCLVAFAKTELLDPNSSQILTLEFSVNDLASYDDLGKCCKSAYILEKGDYEFFAGNSSVNLKSAEYKYTVSEEFIVIEQLKQRCAPNKLSRRMLSDGSFEEMESFPIEDYYGGFVYNGEGAKKEEKVTKFLAVAEGKISLDDFMKQLTDDELVLLVSGYGPKSIDGLIGYGCKGVANTCGFGGIERLGIPLVMTADGPAGIRISPEIGIPMTAWPCSTLIACTWNTELAYEIGRAGALEASENALGIWLTPAINIHRNPLCGRNFEYLSEDPLVSGKIAAAEIRGMQSVGIAASLKHFACNNKENNRFYSDSRLSERALREIYLKGFEICVKEADPWTIMSSYNVINGRRNCESYELLTGILREEWGFKGMVTSDWGVPCDQKNCIKAGNDVRMPDGFPESLKTDLATGSLSREQLKASAKRVLELILKLD